MQRSCGFDPDAGGRTAARSVAAGRRQRRGQRRRDQRRDGGLRGVRDAPESGTVAAARRALTHLETGVAHEGGRTHAPFAIYTVMLLISAVVATAGLLADSPAVVIGAMVIAPLLGPALAANVGIVTGDDRLKSTGFSYQVVGVTMVVVASIALAVLAGWPPRPAGSTSPRPNSRSGSRPTCSRSRSRWARRHFEPHAGFSEAIVGVMIAAALIRHRPRSASRSPGDVRCGDRCRRPRGHQPPVDQPRRADHAVDRRLPPQGLFEVSPTRTPTYTYAAVFGVGLLVLTARRWPASPC